MTQEARKEGVSETIILTSDKLNDKIKELEKDLSYYRLSINLTLKLLEITNKELAILELRKGE